MFTRPGTQIYLWVRHWRFLSGDWGIATLQILSFGKPGGGSMWLSGSIPNRWFFVLWMEGIWEISGDISSSMMHMSCLGTSMNWWCNGAVSGSISRLHLDKSDKHLTARLLSGTLCLRSFWYTPNTKTVSHLKAARWIILAPIGAAWIPKTRSRLCKVHQQFTQLTTSILYDIHINVLVYIYVCGRDLWGLFRSSPHKRNQM